MRLRDLDSSRETCNVLILQTSSNKLKVFLEDKIKKRYKCNMDSTIDCKSKSDIHHVRDVMNVIPPFSEKWYVKVDVGVCLSKEMLDVMKEASTCVFFCEVNKYATFKKLKESLKRVSGVFDFYLTYLRHADIVYLYDAFVPQDKRLTKSLFDYVCSSYSNDIEAVFDLFLALGEGKKVESRKDIADICGVGGNSVESFLLTMLKPPSDKEKGVKRVLSNRLRAGYELSETLGVLTFYNRLKRTLGYFIQIKELLISGVIYKQIIHLPECYDESALSRYQRYVWKLKEIPTSRMIRLYNSLGDKMWRSQLDFLNFVYRFMYDTEKQEILKVKGR